MYGFFCFNKLLAVFTMIKINKSNFPDIFIKEYAPVIPIRKLKKLHCLPKNGGYLWMICDRNLVDNLKGNDAKIAYDAVDKDGAFEFQYDNGVVGDDEAIPLSAENNTAEKIDRSGLYEFYVFSYDFSWCYIVTHELDGCGPFFIKKE